MPERGFPPDLKDILSDWRGCREDIHDQFDKASTLDHRGAVLAIFHAVMNIVEKNLIAPDDLEKFRKARDQDYCLLLSKECTEEANVRSDLLEQATRREVEAGRMQPDHQLRELALVGTTFGIGTTGGLRRTELSKGPKPWRKWLTNWLRPGDEP
jgi:hypothetical protein